MAQARVLASLASVLLARYAYSCNARDQKNAKFREFCWVEKESRIERDSVCKNFESKNSSLPEEKQKMSRKVKKCHEFRRLS